MLKTYLINGKITEAMPMTDKEFFEKFNKDIEFDIEQDGFFYIEDGLPCWMKKEEFLQQQKNIKEFLVPVKWFFSDYAIALKTDDGKNNDYVIANCLTKDVLGVLHFQDVPFTEEVNGITIEDLLFVVVDRLNGFQQSEFACDFNEKAIEYVKKAIFELQTRTEDRKKKRC